MSDQPVAVIDIITQETEVADFKSQFDPDSSQDWCELIKDIVAMANSGGGRLVFGVNDDGSSSSSDIEVVIAVDPANITNKVFRYTGQQFSALTCYRARMGTMPVAVMDIGASRIPIAFVSPGTYETAPGVQKSAFAKGTVYFRHGAKSEPGTTDDFRGSIERELARVKDFWMEGIGKVVTAPPGTVVQVVQQDVSLSDSPGSAPFRLTNDERAPAFRAIQADRLYPYRQKELIEKLNETIGEKAAGPFEIMAIRHAHNIDANPTYSYRSHWKGSPGLYSEAFIEWLISQYRADAAFFKNARESLRRKLRGED